ncbi:hypothetical protein EVAR_60716_1 [Eumeta japonica]|uniref:Uncharacterized protein n=1 Tax=Eumeta variegata TaxID=151549 RepID=A0A4C1ZE93_EUMVA|nr:hypothetical protein EVAR_60716_1 [Eumeta japonica]
MDNASVCVSRAIITRVVQVNKKFRVERSDLYAANSPTSPSFGTVLKWTILCLRAKPIGRLRSEPAPVRSRRCRKGDPVPLTVHHSCGERNTPTTPKSSGASGTTAPSLPLRSAIVFTRGDKVTLSARRGAAHN